MSQVEVQVVGKGFKPGREADAEIAKKLGLTDGEPAPDYCGDVALAVECVEKLRRELYIKPTMGRGYVGIFDHDGAVCVTISFKKEAHAAACALHFLLTMQESG